MGNSFMEPVVEDMVELGVDVCREFFLRMIFRSSEQLAGG